ncbi:hypothetical protein MSAN_02248200 [Mycena sanguinolenta]|uniref:Uncharacterized protein n=1 Tax=Mycena sanguinolenta TaxID=230812 RepID=A0A8H6XBV6_9AGAR|nr:hypothetical protein MSAN_02248200 [Mycena sanguinolenta]
MSPDLTHSKRLHTTEWFPNPPPTTDQIFGMPPCVATGVPTPLPHHLRLGRTFDDVDASKRVSVDDTVTALNRDEKPLIFHPVRQSSLDSAPSPEDDHVARSTGLSFLHRKKSRKASGGILTAEPLPIVDRKKSQLFAPLLHRRLSQDVDANHRFSMEGQESPERPSQDSARVLPKRSQTLRTQPYEAPYFFPAPGSVEADSYLPPRRKPARSKTLAPDET